MKETAVFLGILIICATTFIITLMGVVIEMDKEIQMLNTQIDSLMMYKRYVDENCQSAQIYFLNNEQKIQN